MCTPDYTIYILRPDDCVIIPSTEYYYFCSGEPAEPRRQQSGDYATVSTAGGMCLDSCGAHAMRSGVGGG